MNNQIAFYEPMESVTVLSDSEFEKIDSKIINDSENELKAFISATDNLQMKLLNAGIEPKEMYEYLNTLMFKYC
jgi:hypothetical protein